MLVERYETVNLFNLVPLEQDRVLNELDWILDDDNLFQAVKNDLAQRCPRTRTHGRHSTPVEVILRMLVVKHLYQWSYEQAEVFVSDSITLRQFCRIYLNSVPDDTVLIRWANLIQPETMHQLLDHVVRLAQGLKVTRGRKLRTDGTVVERNIHHPTDSGLLVDGVRVLSRTLKQAQHIIQSTSAPAVQTSQAMFRSRLRSARNTAREISEATRRGVAETGKGCQRAYQKLIQITQASLQQAQDVAGLLQTVASSEAQGLVTYLEGFTPLVEQAIDQTVRRLIKGEKVPARDKIVSLFEPLTDIICRGKKGRPVEFGHKVWLDEIDGGVVSNYRVLEGNPPDKAQWLPSLYHHQALFNQPPDQASGDRGVYSPDNEAAARDLGVQRIILPKPGYCSTERKHHEKQPWFRRGRRYHHGVEGRISVLKRSYGLDRCLYRGKKGFERWIGWGLIAHNLQVIGTKLAAR